MDTILDYIVGCVKACPWFLPIQYLQYTVWNSRDQQPYWITETKESICVKYCSIPGGLVWYTIMAAISLFWNTNMAAVTSCENAL